MTISATAFLSALSMTTLLAASAAAQSDLLVYPANGQTEVQQTQDRSEYSTWAIQQTNFDPMTPAPAYTPPTGQANTQQRGGAVRGAAGGAALGAIGGAERRQGSGDLRLPRVHALLGAFPYGTLGDVLQDS